MSDYGHDPYSYPNSNVLINKFGIRDQQDLSFVERNLTANRLAELYISPIQGNFDYDHLKKIHGDIFQDIYDWAGQERNVNIAKGGTVFCPIQHIKPYAEGIFLNLKKDNYLQGLKHKEFSHKAATLLSDINELHPFREGNGRTQREFMREIAFCAGYDLDLTMVPDKMMLDASIQSHHGLYYGFENMINAYLKPLNQNKFTMQNDMDL